jgi:hypothetical protein
VVDHYWSFDGWKGDDGMPPSCHNCVCGSLGRRGANAAGSAGPREMRDPAKASTLAAARACILNDSPVKGCSWCSEMQVLVCSSTDFGNGVRIAFPI